MEKRRNWDPVAQSLHWLMVLLIAVQAAIGLIGDELGNAPAAIDVMTAHKSLGITLLALVSFRLLWRWGHKPPPPPDGSSRLEVIAARLSHASLYLLMFAVPLSGWLSASTSIIPWKLWWFIPWPRLAAPDKALHGVAAAAHELLLWLLLAVVTVHVAAALYHHLYRRDDVLSAMWEGDN